MRIGFIGLGNLGAAIARRLARAGFDLVGCDVNPEALDAFDEPGVERTADPLVAARGADAVCVCVRMDVDLEALAGDGALFRTLGEGGLFVVHSTVAPGLCRSLAEAAKGHGARLIDAGVSGGAPAALSGELSIYVGGEADAFERARPLLEACGRSVVHLGPVGRGMEGKLLNNLVSIANYGLSAAILDLGESLSFDRAQLREALLAGSAESYALRAVPGLLRPDRAEDLRQLLAKDLEHARALASSADPAMAALVNAAEAMIARLARAAAGA